jgi:hypothetical protein
MKIFKFFLVLKCSRQKIIRKVIFLFQNFRQKRMIPKVNFFEFENLTLKNSKFQGDFTPITIFQGKMKIFKFFLVFKCSRQKMFRKVIIFILKFPGKKERFPKLIFSNLKI